MLTGKGFTRKEFLKVGAGAVAGAILLTGLETRPADASLTRQIALGSFSGANPHPIYGDTSEVDAYTSLVGRAPRIIVNFHPWAWDGSFLPFPISGINTLQSKYPGAMIMLTWTPESSGNGDPNAVTPDNVIAGTHDAFITARAREIVSFGKRILLRFGHEMNGDWYTYGSQWDSTKAAKYPQMWRHVHSIFKAEGANAYAEWVFCPNVSKPIFDSLAFSTYYPGDAYVDWLGLDGYNWGTSKNVPWYSFQQIFENSLSEIGALSAAKGIIVSETGCHSQGGDKGLWFRDMRSYLKDYQPRIQGVAYFDNNQEGAECEVNYPASALADYQAMVNDTQFQAALPPIVDLNITAPAQSFVAPSQLGTSTVPVKLSWSGSKPGGSVVGYELEQSTNGGAYTSVSLPSATATSITPSLAPNATYQFRVRAKDEEGKWSAWAEGSSFALKAYQENSTSVTYPAGTWTPYTWSYAYGGSFRYYTGAGPARAKFSFTGREAAWVATKGVNRGKAYVYLDGAYYATVDLYASTSQPRQVVFRKDWPSSGSHTMEVVYTNTKNASATSTMVDVDAFTTIN